MDTKLIKQFGAKIGSYRIRTERQKKRLRYKDFDKQLLELDFRLDELYEKKRDLGWEPLTPPFQRGWKRFFVLKEDVATDKQADFFEQLLKKINTTDYSWRKDFNIKKRKRGRKVYLAKEQHLQAPGERDFKKHFSPQEQLFFYEQWRTQYGYRSKHFVFSEPWRFSLVVQPNMIDRKRVTDPELESEMEQIEQYLGRRCYYRRLEKIKNGSLGYRYYWYYPKAKEVPLLKKKSVSEWLNEIKHEQIED
ncbi:hypothetical protein LQ567_21260 [Niabella pedocola]|uniref:Uncharacterized protein n=1 Tax=Niabella pedocola TaxID=1752077 RepID=A0ABS8PW76_9BACT|nr:hypothetical protein [Niabella pedocola]MCD2425326.1 hypothetical protein [Niabella pedocola]